MKCPNCGKTPFTFLKYMSIFKPTTKCKNCSVNLYLIHAKKIMLLSLIFGVILAYALVEFFLILGFGVNVSVLAMSIIVMSIGVVLEFIYYKFGKVKLQ